MNTDFNTHHRYEVIEGGKPVAAQKEDVGEVNDPPQVRVGSPRFDHVHKSVDSVRLEESHESRIEKKVTYNYWILIM